MDAPRLHQRGHEWPSRETVTLDRSGLQIREFALPEGEYVAGYEVTDLAGNVARDFLKIRIVK